MAAENKFNEKWFDAYFNKRLFRDLSRERALIAQRETGFLRDEIAGKFNPVLQQHDMKEVLTSFNDTIAKLSAPERVQFINRFGMFARQQETREIPKEDESLSHKKPGPEKG